MIAPLFTNPLRRRIETNYPIRVSFVIDSLSRAGTEMQLLALLRTLNRNVIEPSLVILNGMDESSRALEPIDLPVIRLGLTKLISPKAFRSAWKLRRFWRKHRPDIIQAYFLDSAYFALPVARLCRVKKCLRVRNNLGYWLTRRHRLLEKIIRPFVDVTLTNCDDARKILIDRDGLHPRRVAVLENGVDLLPSPLGGEGLGVRGGPSTDCIPIGCVANLRPVKNIDGLMRAAVLVQSKRPDAKFLIAGDGPERGSLESLRDSLNLGDSFQLLGSVANVPQFLQTLSIVVLPSHSEGMSNALLEAMAAGRAVVATDVGANRRVLDDAGLLVPPGDDRALADAILKLLNDPELAQSLGRAARARVERHFSRDAMRRRFEKFYRDLIT